MKRHLIYLVTTIAFCTPAFAGDKAGNGGDGSEAEFTSIANEVLNWVNTNAQNGELTKKLELKFDPRNFADKLSKAILGTPILFTDAPLKIADKLRACVNGNNRITCNRDLWKSTGGGTKYALVFHEYLGILGLENNNADFSQYPISKNILYYVFATQKYELGQERNDADIHINENAVVYGKRSKVASLVCRNPQMDSELPTITFKVDLANKTVDYESRCRDCGMRANIVGLGEAEGVSYFSSRYEEGTSKKGYSYTRRIDPVLNIFASGKEEDESFDTLVINSASSYDPNTRTYKAIASVVLTVHNVEDGTPQTPIVFQNCNVKF